MIPVLLTTDHLRLRVPSVADAEAIFTAYARDPQVTRYLAWRPHSRLTATLALLQRTIAAIEMRAEAQWVIERQEVEQQHACRCCVLDVADRPHAVDGGSVSAQSTSPRGFGGVAPAQHARARTYPSSPP
jgi:RimJ/RimL family protein N-acetyltransferase